MIFKKNEFNSLYDACVIHSPVHLCACYASVSEKIRARNNSVQKYVSAKMCAGNNWKWSKKLTALL